MFGNRLVLWDGLGGWHQLLPFAINCWNSGSRPCNAKVPKIFQIFRHFWTNWVWRCHFEQTKMIMFSWKMLESSQGSELFGAPFHQSGPSWTTIQRPFHGRRDPKIMAVSAWKMCIFDVSVAGALCYFCLDGVIPILGQEYHRCQQINCNRQFDHGTTIIIAVTVVSSLVMFCHVQPTGQYSPLSTINKPSMNHQSMIVRHQSTSYRSFMNFQIIFCKPHYEWRMNHVWVMCNLWFNMS